MHLHKHPLTVWLQCVHPSAETFILYPTAEHISIQSSSYAEEICTSFFLLTVMREGDISFTKLVKGRLSCSLPIMSMVELPSNSLTISSIILQTLTFVLHFFLLIINTMSAKDSVFTLFLNRCCHCWKQLRRYFCIWILVRTSVVIGKCPNHNRPRAQIVYESGTWSRKKISGGSVELGPHLS